MQQIIAINGASSRLGELASHELAKDGHIVYACVNVTAGRKSLWTRAIRRFAKRNSVDLRAMELDGTSEFSVQSAIRRIVSECGRLDVLIHLAGPEAFGAAGARKPEQVAQLYQAYLLSTQRVNRAALPVFRDQSSGLVIWVAGSQRQEKTPDHLGPYLAAKAALDALAASDVSEFARWNVESTILLPGAMDNARAIIAVVEMTAGTRPLLVHPDNNQTGQETAEDGARSTRAAGFRRMRLSELLRASARRVIDMYS
jgi:NAD(P)-dependent dehydrogenase (short-subunit alcohol dehydrogenase family)